MKWHGHVIDAALVYAFLLSFWPQHASLAQDLQNPPVSLKAENETIETVLLELFHTAKIHCVITLDASRLFGSCRMTISVGDVPLSTAVDMIVRTTATQVPGKRLIARRLNDRYVIDVEDAPVRPVARRQGPEDRLVTYMGRDMSLLSALRSMGGLAGIEIKVHPSTFDALSNAHISVGVKDEAIGQSIVKALQASKQTAGLRALFDYGPNTCVILPPPLPVPTKNPESAIAHVLRVRQTPSAILKLLFESAGVDYVLNPVLLPEEPHVSESLRAPLQEAVRMLAVDVGRPDLRLSSWGGVCWLAAPPRRAVGSSRISAHFVDADLRFAFKGVFASLGCNYTLDALVEGPVTLDIENARLDEAIQSLMKAARCPVPLAMRFLDGVYNVAPDPDYKGWK